MPRRIGGGHELGQLEHAHGRSVDHRPRPKRERVTADGDRFTGIAIAVAGIAIAIAVSITVAVSITTGLGGAFFGRRFIPTAQRTQTEQSEQAQASVKHVVATYHAAAPARTPHLPARAIACPIAPMSRPYTGLPCSLALLSALALSACGSDPDEPADENGETGDGDGDPGDGDGDGDPGDGDGDALRPNWHQDIAPLVHENCMGCHADGGIAPFSLETYEAAAPWGALIDDQVSQGLMPPWGAIETDECQPAHDWRNDLRLSSDEKQLFADWVAAGTPEGDPEDAAPLPAPPNLDLSNPSATFQNPSAFTVGGNEDSFICYSIDPGLSSDVWITGMQLVPDNAQVVHHVLIYVDPAANSAAVADQNGSYPCFGTAGVDGAKLLGSWVPGAVPLDMPDDIGLPMPAGSRIILAYHYHPTGGADEIDQSSLAVRWVDQKPPYEGLVDLLGNFPTAPGLEPGPNDPGGTAVFAIPAGVSDHTETMSITLPDSIPPIDLFALGTHMHYVGVDMKVWIERDGQEICLIQTPRWDFNWQRNYMIDASIGQFPKVRGGDVIKLRCTYDNTLDNQLLAEALAAAGMDAPTNVYLGESSIEEMCLILFGLAAPFPLGG